MITAETPKLSLGALGLLIAINSVACATALARDDSPAGVRMVARVTVPDKGIMCGHTNL